MWVYSQQTSSEFDISLGEHLRFEDNGEEGIVKYIGKLEGHGNEEYLGIDMIKGEGENDG